MYTNLLDTTTRKITVGAIAGYQRYISPHKGFSCAHRILHGGESCSQFVKRVIIEAGVLTAVKASQQRFQACKESNQILKARRMGICRNANSIHAASNASDSPEDLPTETPDEAEKATKKSNPDNCNDCSSMGDCSYISCDAMNCLSGADCSAIDLSGADCSGCSSCGDCGSCSW